MTQIAIQPRVHGHALPEESTGTLLRQLLWLALPLMAEHVLHMLVGINDTWLANHLPADRAEAGAAVGTIAYMMWFTQLIVGSVATGSTALIARAKGARHRSLANSVSGQSITSSFLLGLAIAMIFYIGAGLIVRLTGLQGDKAHQFAFSYLRMLCICLPFITVMIVANACLRGAGDTVMPAVAMIVVDIINMAFSFGLTYGWWGLPRMGFNGIAAGTVIAYVCGGIIQFVVLLIGRGGARLHWHRMRPHWLTLKRIFRIGIPSGLEGLIMFVANFVVVIMINKLDATNVSPAAHNNAIRIEAISYMAGFALAIATATMVGQSLGMKNPRRAMRSAYLAYAIAGGIMTFCGLLFIFFGGVMAHWLSADPRIAALTARCLFITGFIQCSFAGAAVFGGALRGAGDTLSVMLINLASAAGLRLIGVLIVGRVFHGGLTAIWVVLSGELFCRGVFMYGRFLHGGWKTIKV